MRTFWTVIGVIIAVIIAWFIVDLAFSLMWFAFKLVIVAVVAVLVFFGLRAMLSRSE